MKFKEFANITEQNNQSIFIPRRLTERMQKIKNKIDRDIQTYINNGSKGDLKIPLVYFKITDQWPENLKYIGGNFSLVGNGSSEYKPINLPEGLHVTGGIYMSDMNVPALPENLKVDTHLNVKYCQLKTVPASMDIGTSVLLSYNHIQKIPTDKLIVNGSLELQGNPIEELPHTLIVKQNLFLNACRNLTTLPPKLNVWGTVMASKSGLTQIPPSVRIGDDLYIKDTPISKTLDPLINKYGNSFHKYQDEYKDMFPGIRGIIFN